MSHDDNNPIDSNPDHTTDDDALRDALLCHLYGVLDPAEDRAIRDRLARDPHARALLDEVRGDQDVLARAAQLEVGDMTFTPPKTSASPGTTAGRGRNGRRSRRPCSRPSATGARPCATPFEPPGAGRWRTRRCGSC